MLYIRLFNRRRNGTAAHLNFLLSCLCLWCDFCTKTTQLLVDCGPSSKQLYVVASWQSILQKVQHIFGYKLDCSDFWLCIYYIFIFIIKYRIFHVQDTLSAKFFALKIRGSPIQPSTGMHRSVINFLLSNPWGLLYTGKRGNFYF